MTICLVMYLSSLCLLHSSYLLGLDSKKPLKITSGIWYQDVNSMSFNCCYVVEVWQNKFVGQTYPKNSKWDWDLGSLVADNSEIFFHVPETIPIQCSVTWHIVLLKRYIVIVEDLTNKNIFDL